jgi:hypothetical protein
MREKAFHLYRVAHIHAYDVLDTIVVSAQVSEFGDVTPPVIDRTLNWRCTVQGHGDADPSLWLWRVLQILQEELDGSTES